MWKIEEKIWRNIKIESLFLIMLLIFAVISIVSLIIFIINMNKKEELKGIEKIFLIVLFLVNLIYGIITVNNIINNMEGTINIEGIKPVARVVFFPMLNLVIFSIVNMISEIVSLVIKNKKIKIGINVTIIIVFILFYLLFTCIPTIIA